MGTAGTGRADSAAAETPAPPRPVGGEVGKVNVKKATIGDGLTNTGEVVGGALAVVEVVDECKAALASGSEAFAERNGVGAGPEFKQKLMDLWLANNVKKLTDALRKDVLG